MGGSADVPMVVVDDEGEEEVQGEDPEVIGAFTGELCSDTLTTFQLGISMMRELSFVAPDNMRTV